MTAMLRSRILACVSSLVLLSACAVDLGGSHRGLRVAVQRRAAGLAGGRRRALRGQDRRLDPVAGRQRRGCRNRDVFRARGDLSGRGGAGRRRHLHRPRRGQRPERRVRFSGPRFQRRRRLCRARQCPRLRADAEPLRRASLAARRRAGRRLRRSRLSDFTRARDAPCGGAGHYPSGCGPGGRIHGRNWQSQTRR